MRSKNLRVLVLAVVISVPIVACGGKDRTAASPGERTIAFLRAVATQSDEGQQALLSELRARGFVSGRNLTVLAEDIGLAYSDPAEAASVVEGWSDQGVDLIFALSSSGAMTAAEAAPGTPILFISNDPSATGLVTNEEEPEGQLTGATFRVPADRTLDIAMRAFGLKRLGLIYPAEDPAAGPHRESVLAAAGTLGIEVVDQAFTDAESAAAAVDVLARKNIDALFISNSPTAIGALANIEPAAERHGLPTIANTAVATQAVVTLQPDTIELNRQLGRQAARILAGAPVSDVPVEDPRQFSIVIDAGKAKELGIRLDPEVLREADQVRR